MRPLVAIVAAALANTCQPAAGSALGTVDDFGRALVQGNAQGAWALLCPELRDNLEYTRFASLLGTHPYLQSVKSFRKGSMSARSAEVVSQRVYDCLLENQYGAMYADLHVRFSGEAQCVASLVVAGVPVIGLTGPAPAVVPGQHSAPK